MLLNRSAMWLALLAVSSFVVGCGEESSPSATANQPDHEHEHEHEHEGPKTLADAVTALTGFRDIIRDAFAANDPDTAHGPLHDVGHVLEAFEELATKEKVNPENAAVIKSSVESLFTSFGDVDKTMHGQEGKTYSEVSKDIDAALAALSEACGVTKAADAAATSDAAATNDTAHDDKPADAPVADPPVTDAPAADAASDKPAADQ